MRVIHRIRNILREETAATAVEYSVMLVLILMAVFGAIGIVGSQSGGMWNGIETQLQEAGFFN